ncbi:MAG TPA: acyclic terpene utilization AtuA family protein [Frankiaceae bacterium]|nr:acyclic terpene utilization AtuA family protein [Frankiaceae bacterium]
MSAPLRIGNCSGFYGDRLAAMREMLDGGPLDVLSGDYLAELTMLLLFRSRAKDPAKGFATTFLRQLEDCLGTAVERGVKIVANAGGLNPDGCADAVRELAGRLGLDVSVASVSGDDVLHRVAELQPAPPRPPVTANAYLGGWGITAALSAGADIVVAGRTTDAALVTGPAAWHHGWARNDWDRLAGAVVAGHVLECGAHATGGNYAFFAEVPGLAHVGFPLAEIADDGSSVISKHPGTGGLVSRGTVTAQLLYEIGGPAYLGPDVTTRFDTVRLDEDGPDRVRISGVRGTPPPSTAKVSCNYLGGFRNSVTFVLTGLDVEAKATAVQDALRPTVAEVRWELVRLDAPDAATEEQASALLRCHVRDAQPGPVGRAFSAAAIELALASYPGFSVTAPPSEASPYGVFWPAYLPAPTSVVRHADGQTEAVEPTGVHGLSSDLVPEPDLPEPWQPESEPSPESEPTGSNRRAPLGRVFGARSGDKGGDANVGVWARDDAGYAWLAVELTEARLRALLPETRDLAIRRYLFPRLRAVNFVIEGLLGEGVASSTRFDPQAKGLGEWLRSREVDLPESLLGP